MGRLGCIGPTILQATPSEGLHSWHTQLARPNHHPFDIQTTLLSVMATGRTGGWTSPQPPLGSMALIDPAASGLLDHTAYREQVSARDL